MKRPRARHSLQPLISMIAFLASLVAVSNLMPLLLHVAAGSAQLSDAALILGNSAVAGTGIFLLGRQLYAFDKEAGRIRNRMRVFE